MNRNVAGDGEDLDQAETLIGDPPIHPNNPLEFAPRRCYIWAMMTNGGWMLRITGPILL